MTRWRNTYVVGKHRKLASREKNSLFNRLSADISGCPPLTLYRWHFRETRDSQALRSYSSSLVAQ